MSLAANARCLLHLWYGATDAHLRPKTPPAAEKTPADEARVQCDATERKAGIRAALSAPGPIRRARAEACPHASMEPPAAND